jgi:hypothetical protein
MYIHTYKNNVFASFNLKLFPHFLKGADNRIPRLNLAEQKDEERDSKLSCGSSMARLPKKQSEGGIPKKVKI